MKLKGFFKRPFRLSYRSRSLTFAPLGRWIVFLILMLGIAAVNSGSNLIYLVVAMMLSLIIISGILSENSLQLISITRKAPTEIYAATPFFIKYTVQNNKKLMPSFAVSVSDYVDEATAGPSGFMLKLAPGEKTVVEAEVVRPARGVWDVPGVMVSTVFPFGLFRKNLRTQAAHTHIVFPRVFPVEQRAFQYIERSEGDLTKDRKGKGSGIRSVRDYLSDDDARLIHWKSSARVGKLMAMEFESESRNAVCIELDNIMKDDSPESAETFEQAVSLAASVAYHLLIIEDRPISFVSCGIRLPEGRGRSHYLAVMELLATIARIDAETAPPMEQEPGIEAVVICADGAGRADASCDFYPLEAS